MTAAIRASSFSNRSMRPEYTKISLVGKTKALIRGMSTTKRSQPRLSMIFNGLLDSGRKGRKELSVLALGRMAVRDSKRRRRSSTSESEKLQLVLELICAKIRPTIARPDSRADHTLIIECCDQAIAHALQYLYSLILRREQKRSFVF